MKPPYVERRREVMKFVAEGFTDKEIAARMKMSVRLVRWYMAQIFKEHGLYGAGARYKLIGAAFRSGIVK
jgi:DNA-binding NarL/FixJ family response regulator